MLEKVLLPFARFCLRRSIKLQSLLPILKDCLLRAAREELRRNRTEPSAAKLSAMTGVHRKDIRRALQEEQTPRLVEHPVVRLIALWRNDPQFCSAPGVPRPLRIGPGSSEFAELARKIGGDANPYALLFELERSGAVRKEGEHVTLIAKAYADKRQGWSMLAEQIDDVMAAVEGNLAASGASKNLQLKTCYDAIPAAHESEIRAWLLRKGSEFHEETARYLSQFDRDAHPEARIEGEDLIEVSCSAFSVIRPRSAKRDAFRRGQ